MQSYLLIAPFSRECILIQISIVKVLIYLTKALCIVIQTSTAQIWVLYLLDKKFAQVICLFVWLDTFLRERKSVPCLKEFSQTQQLVSAKMWTVWRLLLSSDSLSLSHDQILISLQLGLHSPSKILGQIQECFISLNNFCF